MIQGLGLTLTKESGEMGFAVAPEAVPFLEAACCSSCGRSLSPRLKTWMVPLSDVMATHSGLGDREKATL